MLMGRILGAAVSTTVAGDELALSRLSGTEVLGLSGERLP